jgi:hypothetical protein
MSNDVQNIVSQIQDGTWPAVKKNVPLLPFFTEPLPGQYAVKDETRVQSRDELINEEFINSQIRKVQSTNDYSGLRKPTLVYFSRDVFKDKKVLHEGNSTKVAGGNHGIQISVGVGIFETDAYIIDFEKNCDSKLSTLKAICNGLNTVFEERQSVKDEDIKLEFYELIDERIEAGLDPKPTQEQQHDFLERYPQINSATIANWIAHHDGIGGRRSPIKKWSKPELKATVLSYEDNIAYDNMVHLGATTVAGYDGEMLGRLVKDCTVANKKRAVVTIYAGTTDQVKKINSESKRKIIENEIEEYRKFIKFEEIVVVFLRYQ